VLAALLVRQRDFVAPAQVPEAQAAPVAA
jgi:hypothetical protein